MIEQLARRATVVPMKLFTLFTSDERAGDHIAAQAGAISEVLARIDGCQEWGVRVVRGPRAAAPAPGRPATSGRDYLQQRKAERDRETAEKAALHEECERLFAALSGGSRAARRRPPLRLDTGESLLLEGAFL